ncbi:hypothetical protein MMC08_006033 [Hypocenomyce scalaris]|nr:hypothetical protein [Hypocenomyce scalaris]
MKSSILALALFCLATTAIPIDDVKPRGFEKIAASNAEIAERQSLSDTENQLGDCAPITIIFARGTIELGNVGELAGPPFFNALDILVGAPNVAVQGVDYPATIEGYLEGGDAGGSALLASLTEQAASQCPQTQIVLSGYSQGAQLVHNGAKQISAQVAARVKAVVLFGDPDEGQTLPNIPESIVDSYCFADDLICHGLPIVDTYHLSYAVDATAAAMFVQANTDHGILKDGFKSFTSGHSSTSFAGLFFLSLYLAGKLHILDNRGESWKSLVGLFPILDAALVAISRIEDACYHPFDVLFGSLLGTFVAWYAYRQYFPPLSESWRNGRAYPIHCWTREPIDPNGDAGTLRDRGVEPLRVAPAATDEEQVRNTTYSTPENLAGPGASPSEPRTNIFRQQISQSQRSRQEASTSAYRAEPSLDHPIESHSWHPSKSFTASSQGGGPARTDGYCSSSSSDREDDEEGFELRTQYTVTDHQSQRPSGNPISCNTPVADFGADMTWHPQGQYADLNPTLVVLSQGLVRVANKSPAAARLRGIAHREGHTLDCTWERSWIRWDDNANEEDRDVDGDCELPTEDFGEES